MHNNIFSKINKINDARDYLQCMNLINVYANERGKEHYSVRKLKKHCAERLQEVIADVNDETEKLKKKIKAISSIVIEDTPEQLEQLEKASQLKLYEYLSQLTMNNMDKQGNKRRIGSWCKNPSRTEAIALTKLSIMPEFSEHFTPRYKEVLSANIRNPEQVKHETLIAPTLQELNTKLGHLTMKGFLLKKALKQASN